MPRVVSESEIEAIEQLNACGQYATALASIPELLERTDDDSQRMRILYSKVTAGAFLDSPECVEQAIKDLDALPDSDSTRVLANLIRAHAEDSLGRPGHALAILDAILLTGFFEQPGFRIHKLRLCGIFECALTRLGRHKDALNWIEMAESLYPSAEAAKDENERAIYGWVMPCVFLDKANCLIALGRFEESFQAARTAHSLGDADEKSFALQIMAECRAWQHRPEEALRIYSELTPRLPCRLVEEERVRQGVANCMTSLERRRPPARRS